MPAGTRVDNIYQALKRKGMAVGEAAAIAQKRSGQALATGKPPKHKRYLRGPVNAMSLGRDQV